MCPPPLLIISQLDPVHILTSHFQMIHLNIISHLRLGLPTGHLPSGFSSKTLYTPLLFAIRATCPAHLILPDFTSIARTILGREYNWTILGREYNWTILGREYNWTILGREYNWTILGKEYNWTILGREYNWTILGREYNWTILSTTEQHVAPYITSRNKKEIKNKNFQCESLVEHP